MVSKVSEAMFSLKPSPGTEKQQKSCGDNFHRPVQVFLPHFPTSQIKDPHSQGVLPVFLLQLRNFITHTLNFILDRAQQCNFFWYSWEGPASHTRHKGKRVHMDWERQNWLPLLVLQNQDQSCFFTQTKLQLLLQV